MPQCRRRDGRWYWRLGRHSESLRAACCARSRAGRRGRHDRYLDRKNVAGLAKNRNPGHRASKARVCQQDSRSTPSTQDGRPPRRACRCRTVQSPGIYRSAFITLPLSSITDRICIFVNASVSSSPAPALQMELRPSSPSTTCRPDDRTPCPLVGWRPRRHRMLSWSQVNGLARPFESMARAMSFACVFFLCDSGPRAA